LAEAQDWVAARSLLERLTSRGFGTTDTPERWRIEREEKEVFLRLDRRPLEAPPRCAPAHAIPTNSSGSAKHSQCLRLRKGRRTGSVHPATMPQRAGATNELTSRSEHFRPRPREANKEEVSKASCGAYALRLCGLTFELTGHQRDDASARLAKMYRVPPAGRWWHAVGAPVERGVRRHFARYLY
jgi:hypothetical protein